jgi:4-hydroxybutyryl-CoA dehydratase/vinylacetyl-CoA-Delta-isomerase
MKTGTEYIDSLQDLKTIVYYMGKKIDSITDHLAIRPHINAVAATYDMAHDPLHEDLLTATSHLDGRRISRFTHIPQSTDDLIKKVKMLRAFGQNTGTCFQRCVGMDGLITIYGITYEIDQQKGTNYHQRFIEYLKMIQTRL